MGKNHVFAPDNRVELIEGVIVTMAPIGLWHIITLRVLNEEIVLQLQRRAQVDVQGAVILDDSEPQPDLVVIKAGVTGKAEAKDILLIVEVSDTTLRYDKEVKALLYAAKNIPEYWIIDHANDQIIQFLEPKDGRYKVTRLWSRGETIKSTIEPILTIPVDPILGDKNS
jgi:Uma2 family endonuclease